MTQAHPQAASADIALLLEGTFPYVSGGVSSWLNQIIRAYPEYRFAIVFLGSRRSDYGDFKYALPPNVVHFEEHFLYEPPHGLHEQPAARAGHPEAAALVERLLQALGEGAQSPRALALFQEVVLELMPVVYGVGGKDYLVAPLALAFGYGLIFATVITLVIIPCFYHIAEDAKTGVAKLVGLFGLKMDGSIYRPDRE